MIGECEMTGRQNVELFAVKIEGSLMHVCKECIKYGELVQKPTEFKTKRRIFSSGPGQQDEMIIKDYAKRIKQARESMNLKQSELAQKINEKESLLHKIESNHLKPSFALAKKLSKFLHIKLIETIEPMQVQLDSSSGEGEPLTMEQAFLAAMKKAKK